MDVVTIATAAGATLGASGIIVAFDKEGRKHLVALLKYLPFVLASLPFLGAFWWLYANDFHPFRQLHCDLMDDAWRRSSIPSITFLKPLILDIGLVVGSLLLKVVIILGAAASAVAGTVYALATLPSLLKLPILALPAVARGLWTLALLPYLIGRALFYFVTEPPALRRMRRVTRTSDAHTDDVVRAAADLKEEFEQKRRERSWTPSAVYRAYAYHYHRFADAMSARRARAKADYARSVGRVADEFREDIEARHRARNRGNDDQAN